MKRIFGRMGFKILSLENYKRLMEREAVPYLTYNKDQLLQDFYNLLKDQDFHPENIFDIGANKGTWSKECMRAFPNSRYYLFEPQKELESDIHENLKKCGNYEVFQVGVGNTNKEMNFTIHERDDSCSFLYSVDEASERGFKQVNIPMVRLEDFVKTQGLEYPSMIKIDAEGLDLEVLEGTGDLLSHTEVILVEAGVMNKRIPNTMLKVLENLDSKGFRMFDITEMNRPFSNGVLWLCELVFIKKNGVLDKKI
ncbi:FkbM family methyltransferase [Salinimicrobium sp. WS361]|uniref:FkbM family methyltransferase n=1 Tax=Salinimicrobium sp. WS361 TaxID=3425123 RepID=UPI003D6E5A3D